MKFKDHICDLVDFIRCDITEEHGQFRFSRLWPRINFRQCRGGRGWTLKAWFMQFHGKFMWSVFPVSPLPNLNHLGCHLCSSWLWDESSLRGRICLVTLGKTSWSVFCTIEETDKCQMKDNSILFYLVKSNQMTIDSWWCREKKTRHSVYF